MAMTRYNFDGEEKAPEKHQVFIIGKIVQKKIKITTGFKFYDFSA
jgi:hypothetical protein